MSQDLLCIDNPLSWVMATWGLTILFFYVYLKDSMIKQTKSKRGKTKHYVAWANTHVKQTIHTCETIKQTCETNQTRSKGINKQTTNKP